MRAVAGSGACLECGVSAGPHGSEKARGCTGRRAQGSKPASPRHLRMVGRLRGAEALLRRRGQVREPPSPPPLQPRRTPRLPKKRKRRALAHAPAALSTPVTASRPSCTRRVPPLRTNPKSTRGATGGGQGGGAWSLLWANCCCVFWVRLRLLDACFASYAVCVWPPPCSVSPGHRPAPGPALADPH
jgi:hypothetical protein